MGHSRRPLIALALLALALASAPLRASSRELSRAHSESAADTAADTASERQSVLSTEEAGAAWGHRGRVLQDGSNLGEGFWSVKGTDYVDSNGQTVSVV